MNSLQCKELGKDIEPPLSPQLRVGASGLHHYQKGIPNLLKKLERGDNFLLLIMSLNEGV